MKTEVVTRQCKFKLINTNILCNVFSHMMKGKKLNPQPHQWHNECIHKVEKQAFTFGHAAKRAPLFVIHTGLVLTL